MKLFASIFLSAFLCFGFLNVNNSNVPVKKGKPALAKSITKLLGAKVSGKNVWTFNTRQIHQWNGVPDFLVEGLGTKYKRFAYARYNKKIKGVSHFVFTVPAELREEFNIDFVVAESNDGRPDGTGLEFKPCTMKFCDLHGNCVPLEVLTDGICVDMCNSSGDCPEMEQCNKRMCQGSSCQNSIYWSAKCNNTPACNTNEDCGGLSGKKTCYLKQCQSSECISISIEIDMNSACPPNECSGDSECVTLGVVPTILEAMGF